MMRPLKKAIADVGDVAIAHKTPKAVILSCFVEYAALLAILWDVERDEWMQQVGFIYDHVANSPAIPREDS